MTTKYSFQGADTEKVVKVLGRNLPISHKASYEVANAIKGKNVNKAVAYLERVLEQKDAIPFKRYNRDTPHRKGKIAAGRYPKKTSEHVLALLKALMKNAEAKHMNVAGLKIVHAAAQKGPRVTHPGRLRGTRKITHFEIVGKEVSEAKKEEKKK